MSATEGPETAGQQLFAQADAAEWVEFAPGKRRRILLHTLQLMQMESAFDEGISTPLHRHPHQQVSYVLEGRVRVTVGGETVELTAGGSFIVPAGMIHGAVSLTAATLLDTFTPARQDYL